MSNTVEKAMLGMAISRMMADSRDLESLLWGLVFECGEDIHTQDNGIVKRSEAGAGCLHLYFLLLTESDTARKRIAAIYHACVSSLEFEEVDFSVGVMDDNKRWFVEDEADVPTEQEIANV